jgi:protein phosphatase
MAYIAHCGDSRVYVLRKDGRLEQLTTDHDMLSNPDVIHKLEERFHREFPQTAIDKYRELLDSVSGETEMPDALGRYLFHSRNIVHSSLGSGSGIRIDTNVTEISEGDTLILCSDGLSGNLTRQRIQDISATAGSPEELVERAAHEAYEYAHLEPPSYTKGQPRVRNHRDDITVIVAKGK